MVRITHDWNYKNRYIAISIPGYIKKQLQKYDHIQKEPPQDSPYPAPTKKYGKATQDPSPDDTKELSKDKKKCVKQVVGRIFYYARAVEITLLVTLNTIAAAQSKVLEFTIGSIEQVLD